jgi:hypothetical protein
VTLAEDKDIALFPSRVGRVAAHYMEIETRQNLNDRHGSPEMPTLRASAHIHYVIADPQHTFDELLIKRVSDLNNHVKSYQLG